MDGCGVGAAGGALVSPTMEEPDPLIGQAWEEVPILGSSDLHGDS